VESTQHFSLTLYLIPDRSVPILVLVDGDPHGVDILSVYKFGSIALKHEDDRLAARRVEWVGIWASELAGYVLLAPHADLFIRAYSLNIDKDALIPISRNDEKKVLSLAFSCVCFVFFQTEVVDFQALAMLRRSSTMIPLKWKFVPSLIFAFDC
jgi:hypothetical protein